jgi:thioredoxin:protein disulfide reductase
MKMSYLLRIKLTLLFGACLLSSSLAHAQFGTRSDSGLSSQSDIDRPLPIEQAFPFYVSAISPGKYRVVWDLPDGHYLYGHAFGFSLSQQADGEDLPVDFTLPEGLKKNDQFFGDIEAYYGQLDIDLALSTVPGPEARIYIEYQGCADWGFCYPPQRFEFLLNP